MHQCKVKYSRHRPGVAQRMGRGISLLFHDRGTRWVWVVSSTSLPHFTPGKDPVPILQEAGWAQGRSGLAENLVPTGIRSRTVQPIPTELHGLHIYIYIYILHIYIYLTTPLEYEIKCIPKIDLKRDQGIDQSLLRFICSFLLGSASLKRTHAFPLLLRYPEC